MLCGLRSRVTSIPLFLLVAAGCASPSKVGRAPQVFASHEISKGTAPATALSFEYSLQLIEKGTARQGCDLFLTSVDDSNVRASMKIVGGSRMGTYQAAPGKYRISELYCSGQDHWLFGKANPILELKEGSISYAGRVQFHQDPSTRDMIYQFQDAPDQATIQAFHSKLSSKDKGRLVSAFTVKPITAEMITATFNEKLKRAIRAGRQVEGEASRKKLEDCVNEEFKRNPTVLGTVEFHSQVLDGKLLSMDPVVDKSTYSSQLIECVEKELREYNPGTADLQDLRLLF